MKILYFSDQFYPFSGGKSVASRRLLRELAQHHRIMAVSLAAHDQRFAQDGLDIRTMAWPRPSGLVNRIKIHHRFAWGRYLAKSLGSLAQEFMPDLIFTDGTVAWTGVQEARRLGVMSVFFNHDFDGLCPDRAHYRDPLNCGQNCFSCTRRPGIKLFYPLVGLARRRYLAAIKNAGLVFANSLYTQRVVQRFTGIKPELMNPIIETGCLPKDQAQKREAILFVKPARPKGAELVLRLARSLPGKKFIVVGSPEGQLAASLKALPNVEWTAYQAQMSELYARSRLVLVPSLLPETFGMVAAEAMQCGAVPLVSDRGALPEAVAGAGVVLDPIDYQAWKQAAEKLFQDQNYWQGLSLKGRELAGRYSAQNILAGFKHSMSQNLGLDL